MSWMMSLPVLAMYYVLWNWRWLTCPPPPPPPFWKNKKSWLPKDLEMVILIACSYLSVLYEAQFTPLANFEKMWPAPGKGTVEHNSNNRQNVKNFSLSENLMYYYLYHVKCRYGRNWILCIKKCFFSRRKKILSTWVHKNGHNSACDQYFFLYHCTQYRQSYLSMLKIQ